MTLNEVFANVSALVGLRYAENYSKSSNGFSLFMRLLASRVSLISVASKGRKRGSIHQIMLIVPMLTFK